MLITAQGPVILVPSSTLEEVAQNVRTIITTPKYSVPLDREFGINMDFVDAPALKARARMTSEIMGAIERYEPRCVVKRISWANQTTENSEDGTLLPVLEVDIRV